MRRFLSLILLFSTPLPGLCDELSPIELFDRGDFKRAVKRCRVGIKENSGSENIAKMHLLIGRSFEKLGKPSDAAESYVEVLKSSAGEANFAFAWERLKAIVDYYYEKAGSKRFGGGDYTYASDTLQKMVELAPYHSETGSLRLKIGLCAIKCGDFSKAIIELKGVVDGYKGKPVREEALFQLGTAYFKESLPWQYDRSATEKGISVFNMFEADYPKSRLLSESEKMRTALIEREAEKLYRTAEFYKESGKENASFVYRRQLLDRYPQTNWGRTVQVSRITSKMSSK